MDLLALFTQENGSAILKPRFATLTDLSNRQIAETYELELGDQTTCDKHLLTYSAWMKRKRLPIQTHAELLRAPQSHYSVIGAIGDEIPKVYVVYSMLRNKNLQIEQVTLDQSGVLPIELIEKELCFEISYGYNDNECWAGWHSNSKHKHHKRIDSMFTIPVQPR